MSADGGQLFYAQGQLGHARDGVAARNLRISPSMSARHRPCAAIVLVLASVATADGYAGVLPIQRTLRAPIVMRKVDDTAKAAAAAAAREAEEARRVAEENADPEPGPCPECADEGTYWDGMLGFACTSCGYEWTIEDAKAAAEELITRDVDGAEINSGDQVVLVKDLAGGTLKRGTKVKVKLGDFGDNHDLQAVIPSKGTYALKSEFVKKA